jgi:hypothetical protein
MSHKSTRLGDLLIEQRAITALQLREAIELQEKRRLNLLFAENVSSITGAAEHIELGEILIELGFISRQQLNSSLSWQRSLRKATTVMVFIAPLLTAACGGGAGSPSEISAQSNNVSSQALSTDKPATTQSSTAKSSTAKSSAVSSSKDVTNIPAGSVTVSSASSLKSASSTAVLSSKASSSKASSSKALSSSALSSAASKASSSKPAASSLASSSIKSSVVNGAVQLYWDIPKQREDGEALDVTEISGYEVQFKLRSDENFQSVNISDGYADAYLFNYLQGDYQFQIATYDKNGLYSAFVSISPN